MKIAVISDIHGNLPALERVAEDLRQWQPDQVIVNGDIVNRGPCSDRCWTFVQQRAKDGNWQLLRGNHEDFVIRCAHTAPPQGVAFEIQRFAYWTQGQLNGDTSALAELPDKFELRAPDGGLMRVVHGSMRSNREGLYMHSPHEKIAAQIAPPPAVFVTAHTHRPFVRTVGETVVVNVGAIGAPFDRDKRLSYGRFTWSPSRRWQGELVRLEYDWQKTEKDYVTSGFLSEGGPLVQLMLLEHRKSHGLIYRWAQRYEQAVLNGELTLADSVQGIMRDEDVYPYIGAPGWLV